VVDAQPHVMDDAAVARIEIEGADVGRVRDRRSQYEFPKDVAIVRGKFERFR
jgi:hypothetical protein